MSDKKKVSNLGKGPTTPVNVSLEFPFDDMDSVIILGRDKEGRPMLSHSDIRLDDLAFLAMYLQATVTASFLEEDNS